MLMYPCIRCILCVQCTRRGVIWDRSPMSTLLLLTPSQFSSTVHTSSPIRCFSPPIFEKLKGLTNPSSARFAVPWYQPRVCTFFANVSSTLCGLMNTMSPKHPSGLSSLITGQCLSLLVATGRSYQLAWVAGGGRNPESRNELEGRARRKNYDGAPATLRSRAMHMRGAEDGVYTYTNKYILKANSTFIEC